MAAKVICAGIALLATGACVQTPVRDHAAREHFKRYALATCLADGYRGEEVVKDSAAAARAYLERGSFPLEAHTEATKLGRTFLAKEYPSISGQPLILMKCIDFFGSQELDQLARKYDKSPN